MSSSPRRRRFNDRASRDAPRLVRLFLVERRQLRAIVGDENREQAGRLGRARILTDEMLAAGRLKEGLAGLVYLGRSGRGVLRANLTGPHIGHHAAGVMVAG